MPFEVSTGWLVCPDGLYREQTCARSVDPAGSPINYNLTRASGIDGASCFCDQVVKELPSLSTQTLKGRLHLVTHRLEVR